MSTEKEQIEYIEYQIRKYPGYSSGSVVLPDIYGLLTDPKACLFMKLLLTQHIVIAYPEVEMIVGVEAGGFLLNLMLAAELGIGCAVIREKGKLPGELVSYEYTLENDTNMGKSLETSTADYDFKFY